MEANAAESRLTAQAGNPLLGQIHEFIQTDQPAPLDPLGLAARALRGRVVQIAVTALAAAVLFAVLAWFAIVPLFQSTAAVRVLPPALVKGRIGDHYLLDGATAPAGAAPPPAPAGDGVPGLDYLNAGDG